MYSGGVFFMLKSQQELNFSQYTDLYDKLIPQNHLFRKINELIDFSFIREVRSFSIVVWFLNLYQGIYTRLKDGHFCCYLQNLE